METRRRSDYETVEDRVAKILAAAYGYGDPLPMTGLEEQPHREWDSGADALEPEKGAIRVAERGNATQQAGRAISKNKRQQDPWVRDLPSAQRDELMQWSGTHPLQAERGEIGQQRQWRSVFGRIARPRGPRFENQIVALVDSERAVNGEIPLSRIELAMLRAFALQEWPAVERVINCAVKAGHRRDIAQNAFVYRIMFPDGRRLHHSVAGRALEIGMRKEEYSMLEQRATDLLRMWLHEGCMKFMHQLTMPLTEKDFPTPSHNVLGPREHARTA